MKILVKKDHIRLGSKYMNDCTKCIVGRAMRAAGFKKAEVGATRVWKKGAKGLSEMILLPRHVAHAIQQACSEDFSQLPTSIKPFSFNLTKKQVAILS